MSGKSTLLQCRGLVKSYGNNEGSALSILQDLDLNLDRGQSVAVVGPSGCGKSTLLNLIGTLDRADQGKILFDGKDITQFNDREAASFRNLEIGFIFQEHHLLPQCTVLENVLVPVIAPGSRLKGKVAIARAKSLLEQVGLSHRHSHRPAQISGGERQRVSVARALIQQPRLLLADEPTGSLDRETAHQLTALLLDMMRSHDLAMLVVTHAEGLANQMDRCLELQQGHLVLKEGAKP